MKKILAALIAGIVFGSTGLALGQGYWAERGRTYSCKGYSQAVFCTETNWQTNYKTAIFPGRVTVSYGRRVIFGCERGYLPYGNCIYFGG